MKPNGSSIVLAVLLASLLGPVLPSSAGPRDAPAITDDDAVLTKCLDSPECATALRKRLQDEERTEARFQALPLWQKLLRWALLPAAVAALWFWLGRKN